MKLLEAAILATLFTTAAALAMAQTKGDASLFKELDANGDGSVDREEFTLNKGAIFYRLDKNRSLKLEKDETKLDAEQFRRYAGKDGIIDGVELFEVPGARFESFDFDGDQRIVPNEFKRQLANLRSGSQTAERP